MDRYHRLQAHLESSLGSLIQDSKIALQELTLEVLPENLIEVSRALRDDPDFRFEMLMDVCGVDYLHYGCAEWATEEATYTGFSRGQEDIGSNATLPRFAVVYHLLSLTGNRRLRIKTFPQGDPPVVPSVISIWSSADWFEREAFDLFGILFDGHPDLRRILTDYGFIGHPFRKDFPLSGTMEMRYSAKDRRVIYEPVSIPPRTLVPKTIRHDNRYIVSKNATNNPHKESRE